MSDTPSAASPRRRIARAAACILAGALAFWLIGEQLDRPLYVIGGERQLIASLPPAPAEDSATTRRELDELLAIQARRTAADVAAARRDRRNEIGQFSRTLGLATDEVAQLRAYRRLFEQVEDDIRPLVRDAKDHFLRPRPFESEPRLDPCIYDVRRKASYPSGHATYAYTVALLLAEMVPEKRTSLLERAREYSRQRMVCGVHFESDLQAGRIAAEWLVARFMAEPRFQENFAEARRELRAALRLPV